MIPLRKPKRRPSDLECRLCHQLIGWQHCEYCHGYGSWDQGVGTFRCLFCGGTGWQSEPHACTETGEDEEPVGEAGWEAAVSAQDAADEADIQPTDSGPLLTSKG